MNHEIDGIIMDVVNMLDIIIDRIEHIITHIINNSIEFIHNKRIKWHGI